MQINKLIFYNAFLIFILTGCVMPEEYLRQTELQETDDFRIIYKGNTVWLEPKNLNYLGYDGRVVYKMKKIKGGFAPRRIEYYDSTFNLITSDKNHAIEIHKYNLFSKKESFKFLNNKKELIEPEFFNYAKVKYHFLKDGSFIVRYYDKNNKRRCGQDGYLVRQKNDTIQIQMGDTITEGFTYITMYKLDCKGDTIK